jgi:phage gp29-like protein
MSIPLYIIIFIFNPGKYDCVRLGHNEASLAPAEMQIDLLQAADEGETPYSKQYSKVMPSGSVSRSQLGSVLQIQ